MSDRKKVTVNTLKRMKEKGEKIVCLTAYDYSTAAMLDESGVDLLLVGDSASMVVAGYDSTLPISMDEMIFITKWVSRAKPKALLIGDMPFGSYQPDISTAIKNATRFIQEGGADGVKIEGGKRSAETARALVEIGIPVMGHIGMTPQSVNEFGGYKVKGKTDESHDALIDDAKELQDAGVFSIVLEAVKTKTGTDITRAVDIPTIGIGAGPECDGQILVINDLIGSYNGFEPNFVRRYADVGNTIREAVKKFSGDVKSGDYPSADESYE